MHKRSLACNMSGSPSCLDSKTWLSKILVHVFFPQTWLSKFWFMLCFPRLGCPSFGLFCFPRLGCPSFGLLPFSKTWLSKFWFVCLSKTWLSKLWFCVFFQDLVVQVVVLLCFPRLGCSSFGLRFFSKTWLSKFWFVVFARLGCSCFGLCCLSKTSFSKTWLSMLLVHVFSPRLGCPRFGSCCVSPRLGCPSCGLCFVFQDLVVQVLVHVLFSKTWLSKFWFVAFFQDLVVQVLVHVFFPRLGCPSFGSCCLFPRLGCPSCGLCCVFQDLVVRVLVYVLFSKTWLSKFWFMCFFQDLVVQVLVPVFFPKTWMPSFGLLYFCPIDCSSFGFCFCQDLVVQVLVCCSCKTWLFKFWFVVCPRLVFCCWFIFSRTWLRKFQQISLSLSVQRHREGLSIRLRTLFFVFQVLVDVSSTVFEFNGVCSKMLICINLQAVVLHLLLHRRRRRLGGVSWTFVASSFTSLEIEFIQSCVLCALSACLAQEGLLTGNNKQQQQQQEQAQPQQQATTHNHNHNNNQCCCSKNALCCGSVNRHGAQGHWLHFIVCTFADHGFGNDFFCQKTK